MDEQENMNFLVWIYKLSREEYNGDVNLCLLELELEGLI